MTTEKDAAAQPVGSPLDEPVRPLGDGEQKPACQHQNSKHKHYTYGLQWWCPDCGDSREDWWD